MRTATLPAVRVTPEVRALAESVLKKGETLSMFIEDTVRNHAQWRSEDAALVARAVAASKRLDAGGLFFTAEQSIARLQAMSKRKKDERVKKFAKAA